MNGLYPGITAANSLNPTSAGQLTKGPNVQAALDEQFTRLNELGKVIIDLETRLQPVLENVPSASGSNSEGPKSPPGILYTVGEHSDAISWYTNQIRGLINRLHI